MILGLALSISQIKGLDFGDIDLIIKKVKHKLSKHNPKPSLLHGNLWIENTAIVGNQTFTYDPACYWVDR